MNIVTQVGTLPYTGVVSASITNDGKELLIKTYPGLFFYKRNTAETIEQTLQKSYKTLQYQIEPQGEAVTFAMNGTGYFTLSEKGFASRVNLFFYKRK
jgi:hypothetical protein